MSAFALIREERALARVSKDEATELEYALAAMRITAAPVRNGLIRLVYPYRYRVRWLTFR
jgi:hypothetical protein